MRCFFLGIKALIHKTNFTFQHTRCCSITKFQGLPHVILKLHLFVGFIFSNLILSRSASLVEMHSILISYLVSLGPSSIAHCFPIMCNGKFWIPVPFYTYKNSLQKEVVISMRLCWVLLWHTSLVSTVVKFIFSTCHEDIQRSWGIAPSWHWLKVPLPLYSCQKSSHYQLDTCMGEHQSQYGQW
jgi:hypothetical protein